MPETSQTEPEPTERTSESPKDALPGIPWENRDGGSSIGAWISTMCLVLRRFGRLGPWMQGEVSIREAVRFRRMTVIMASVPMLAVLLFVVGGAAIDVIEGGEDEAALLAVAGGCAAVLVLYTGMLAGWAGIVTWFLAPGSLPAELRDRAAALSYYLTAPAGLSALSLLAIPFALMAGGELPSQMRLGAAVLAGCIAVPLVLWYVLAIVGSRSLGRRGGTGVLVTAMALPVVWAVFGAMLLSVPAGVLMWALMRASIG